MARVGIRRTGMILVDINESVSGVHTRAVNLHQLLDDRTITSTSHDSASHTEITVKPWNNAVNESPKRLYLRIEHTGVPDTTTITLHANLDEAFAAFVADGLDPQDGRVGVGTDHGNGVTGLLQVSQGQMPSIFGAILTFHCLPIANATRVVVLRVR